MSFCNTIKRPMQGSVQTAIAIAAASDQRGLLPPLLCGGHYFTLSSIKTSETQHKSPLISQPC